MKKRNLNLPLACLGTLILLPTTAYADTVWQALFFEKAILARTWWVIPLGLLIEWPAVKKIITRSWYKAGLVTVVMNVVSFMVGILLQLPTLFIGELSGVIAIFALAIVGNTLIEGFIINMFYKKVINLQAIGLLLGVNVLSVGITVAVLMHYA